MIFKLFVMLLDPSKKHSLPCICNKTVFNIFLSILVIGQLPCSVVVVVAPLLAYAYERKGEDNNLKIAKVLHNI